MQKNVTILIIDDDDDDRRLFIESTKEVDENINCIGVSGGQEALDYLNYTDNILPDYLFLDLRMPKMSGQKCMAEIKKLERLQSIPIFIYTTSKDDTEIANMQKEGAVMFITKPTNPEEIYYLLSVIIGEKWR